LWGRPRGWGASWYAKRSSGKENGPRKKEQNKETRFNKKKKKILSILSRELGRREAKKSSRVRNDARQNDPLKAQSFLPILLS